MACTMVCCFWAAKDDNGSTLLAPLPPSRVTSAGLC
jgi:hypothetical protein